MQRGMRKLWELMNTFIILILMMVSQMYTYVKPYQVVHFKYLQLILCQLYIYKADKNAYVSFCVSVIYFYIILMCENYRQHFNNGSEYRISMC